MTRRCMLCGQIIPPNVLFGRRRMQQAIYDYIVKHPEGVSRTQIFDAVYGDREDGGPESLTVVSVHLNRMRPVLHAAGLDILSPWGRGPGARYRLVAMEERP